MSASSDTSDTPTLLTDDLLDSDSEDFAWKHMQHEDHYIDLRFSDGKVLSKVNFAVLKAQSSVFIARLEKLREPTCEVRGTFKGWCLVLELVNKSDPPKAVYTLQHIAEALEIAKYYEMHLAETALIVLAMGWFEKNPVAVATLLEDASHPLKPFVKRALEWETSLGTGSMDFSRLPSVLVERFKTRCTEKAVRDFTNLRKTRLTSVLSIMSMHSIETCDDNDTYGGNCHWKDGNGATLYAGRKSSKSTPHPSAASALWSDAKEQMRGYAEAVDMPSSSMAMSRTEKDILARPCCSGCKKEIKTLFRLTKMLAQERKLL